MPNHAVQYDVRVKRPQVFYQCVGIAVRSIIPALLGILRGMLEPELVVTAVEEGAALSPMSQEASAAPAAIGLDVPQAVNALSAVSEGAEAVGGPDVSHSVLSGTANTPRRLRRISPASWVSPRAAEVYCSVLASTLRALQYVCQQSSATGHIAYAIEGLTLEELRGTLDEAQGVLVTFCEALAALPADVLKREAVAVCDCMKSVSTALCAFLGRSSPVLHRIQRALIESALSSNNLQRRRWGLDEIAVYLTNIESLAPASVTAETRADARGDLREAAEWLTGRHVNIFALLLDDSTHEELLRRAGPVVSALVRARCVTPEDVDRMWSATLSAHATSADAQRDLLASFVDSAAEVSPELVQRLCDLIRATANDPLRFADAALVTAKLAKLMYKEVDASDKGAVRTIAATRRSTHDSGLPPAWHSVFACMVSVLLHDFAPTLALADAAGGAAKDAHDEREDPDEDAPEDNASDTDDDTDCASDCSADSASDKVVSIAAEVDASLDPSRGCLVSEASGGAALASLAVSFESPEDKPRRGSALPSASARDSAVASVLLSMWTADWDTTRAVEGALEGIAQGLCRLLDVEYDPTLTSSVFLHALCRLGDVQDARDYLCRGDTLLQIVATVLAARDGKGPKSFRDHQASFAGKLASLHPSTDPVPRILDFVRRLLVHIQRRNYVWHAYGDRDIVLAMAAADVDMVTVVSQANKNFSLLRMILDEATSYARYMPRFGSRAAGMSKRLGVLYSLMRYAKDSSFLGIGEVEELFAACNQWPSSALLHESFSLARSEVVDGTRTTPSCDVPSSADAISTSVLRSIAMCATTATAPTLSLHCHDLREALWVFLRRVVGGGAYDLVASSGRPSEFTRLADPEDLIPSARVEIDVRSAFDVDYKSSYASQRVSYASTTADCLVTPESVEALFRVLFAPAGSSPIATN